MNDELNKDNAAALRQLKAMNEIQEIGFPSVLVTEGSTTTNQSTILQLCASHFFPIEGENTTEDHKITQTLFDNLKMEEAENNQIPQITPGEIETAISSLKLN